MSASRTHIVSRTLKWGIFISGGLMLIGFVLYALQPEYHDAAIPAATFAWLSALMQQPPGRSFATPWLYLYAGIFALMLTPIVRIIITGYTFALDRDWRYVAISLIVLCVVGLSIVFSVTH